MKKNTEPIGFLGTTGLWKIAMNFQAVWAYDKKVPTVICDIRIDSYTGEASKEEQANVRLLAASKQLAVALQNLTKRASKYGMFVEDNLDGKALSEAKEALKAAGL